MVDIEWDYWSSKPYVYTWQAAALVQGLNPKKIKFPVRDAAGELHFDRSNFGNAYPDFKAKLDLIIEHAWIQNFSAQNNQEIEIIVTRNIKDYKTSKLVVMTPETYSNSLG